MPGDIPPVGGGTGTSRTTQNEGGVEEAPTYPSNLREGDLAEGVVERDPSQRFGTYNVPSLPLYTMYVYV